MNLAGGQKKSEASEFLDITVVSNTEPSIQKSMRAYAINKPCSPARTVSRTTLESYPHLKSISEQLHLSGGTVDLLIGTDFADAFNDMHVIAGKSGEPIAKRNCFGWYVMGTFASKQGERPSAINSIDVGTVDVLEDMKKLLTQDMLGVRPTNFVRAEIMILRRTSLSNQLQNRLRLLRGESRCECLGMARDPQRRAITMLHIKE